MSYDINAIKRRMLVKYPFFGSVVANVDYKDTKSIGRAGTDGFTIYYNPDYINSLNMDEQTFVFAHEVCHIAFNHIMRSDGKNPRLWNIAADGVVNQLLKRDGLPLVENAVDMADAINYDVENLYNKLLKEEEEKRKQQEEQRKQQEQQQQQNQSQQDNQDEQQQEQQQEQQVGEDNEGNKKGQSGGNSNQEGNGQQSSNGNGEPNEPQDQQQSNNGSDSPSDQQQENGQNSSSNQGGNGDSSGNNGQGGSNGDSGEDSKNQDQNGNGNGDGDQSDQQDQNQNSDGSGNGDQSDQQDQNQNSDGSGNGDQSDQQDQNQNSDGNGNNNDNKDNQDTNSDDDPQEDTNDDEVGHDTHKMWEDAVRKQKNEQKKNKNGESLLDRLLNRNKNRNKNKNELSRQQEQLEKMGEKAAFDQNQNDRRQQLEELKKALSEQSSHGAGSTTNEDVLDITDIGVAKPIVDWRYILREAIKFDVDWSYKNATIEDGVVVPNLEEMPLPETEIVLDTSGSINTTMLKNFLRECKNILQHTKLKVGCFDTKFYGFHEIRTEDDIENMKFEGGGGTDFDVAVEAFSMRVENKIIFTDGEASMPKKPLDAIWMVFGNNVINPEGGRVIQINEEQLNRLCHLMETQKVKIKK